LANFKQHRNRDVREELNILAQKGFSRTASPNPAQGGILEAQRIEELLELSDKELKARKISYILVDRIVVKDFTEDDIHRISDSAGTAFYEGEGDVYLEVQTTHGLSLLHFNNRFEADGMQFEEPVPNLFSFNNPFGACPTCEGFSQVLGIDTDLVIPDKRQSVYDGAVAPWKGEKLGWWREQFIKGAKKFAFPVHKAIVDLTPKQYEIL